jgi:SAM-dependent methyltransferase
MSHLAASSLAEWFDTPLGEYVLSREREWLDASTPDIFGFHAIQLGMPVYDLLRESRIAHRVMVDPVQGEVRAQFHELPFDEQSIDLCVLSHVLEFAENPHEILREVDRVMRPEGRILIIGFNPWSLFGAPRLWAQSEHPWCGQFVSLVRMKDWLQLLSFEPAAGKLACYIPPVQSEKWLSRWKFMESTGDRWWGVAGGVYMLEAVKRVQGMRLIAPAWRDKAADRKYAAATNRAARAGTKQRQMEQERSPHHGAHLHIVK